MSTVLLFLVFSMVGLLQAESNVSDSTAAIRSAVCVRQYSVSCLKLDIVGLVERMGGGGQYQLLPGVFLSHELSKTKIPEELIMTLKDGNSSKEIDSYISNRVNEYLSSLTLSVKVLDSNTVNHARKLSDQILSNFVSFETGRKKGGHGGAAWAAGTVAAVGVSALAAISGKALMTSLLALLLAGAGAMRGGGGGAAPACPKSAALIDAHARTIELDRLADEAEFFREHPSPVYRPAVYGPGKMYGPTQH